MRSLTVIVCLLACAGTTQAQCRSRSYSYNSGYSYSYTAPTYSYAPTYSAPYTPPTVYKEEKVIKFLAVLPLVELPSYSAVYSPPPVVQAAQSLSGRTPQETQQILSSLDRLEKGLQSLNNRVESLERSGRFQPPPTPTPTPTPLPKAEQGPTPKVEGGQTSSSNKLSALQVNVKSCAVCHEKGNESNGGDFVLSEGGKFVRLDDTQLVSMSRVLAKGTMPKLNAKAKQHGITSPLTKEEAEAMYAMLDEQIANGK